MLDFRCLTPELLLQQFDVQMRVGAFLAPPAPLPLPGWLRDYLGLNFLSPMHLTTKGFQETTVAPLLAALKAHCYGELAVFSGERLAGAGLTGTADFLLSCNPHGFVPENPGLVVTAADKQSLYNGLAPCVGALLAARADPALRPDASRLALYGCVTTGNQWQFLRLTGSLALVDTTHFYPADIELVLGHLAWIVEQLA